MIARVCRASGGSCLLRWRVASHGGLRYPSPYRRRDLSSPRGPFALKCRRGWVESRHCCFGRREYRRLVALGEAPLGWWKKCFKRCELRVGTVVCARGSRLVMFFVIVFATACDCLRLPGVRMVGGEKAGYRKTRVERCSLYTPGPLLPRVIAVFCWKERTGAGWVHGRVQGIRRHGCLQKQKRMFVKAGGMMTNAPSFEVLRAVSRGSSF